MGTRRSRHNKGVKPLYKEHRLHQIHAQPIDYGQFVEDNSFLLSPLVAELTFEGTSTLSLDAAFELFKSIRFYKTSGEPECPYCQGRNLYIWRGRFGGSWRCKDCRTEFSITAGTAFHNRKLPLRTLLMALSVTIGKSQCPSYAQCAVRLGISYHTILRLLKQIRSLASLADLPDRAPQAPLEIGRDRYYDGALYSTRTWWTDQEKDAVRKFINRGNSPTEVAPALGRTARSIAWYARDLDGVKLPPLWSALIAPKRIITDRRAPLAYPYIMTQRPEHADILALNDLVPRAYPEHMRADICQEMMMAVLEGTVTIDEIKANRTRSAWFLKKFWMANYEASGRAISFQNVDDGWNADSVESSIAAKEWHREQFAERTRFVDSVRTFSPPTQIEDVWANQIHRRAERAGISFDEMADLLENSQ